jgi:hypothetical protein
MNEQSEAARMNGTRPSAGSGGWDERLEAWWQSKVASFPGGIVNAVWHMPDAAARRMRWLDSFRPNSLLDRNDPPNTGTAHETR